MFECHQQLLTFFMVIFCLTVGFMVVARCLAGGRISGRRWFWAIFRLRLRRVWCRRRVSTTPPPLPPPPCPPSPPDPAYSTSSSSSSNHMSQAPAAPTATAVTSSKKRKW
jgi:hypothetical protein